MLRTIGEPLLCKQSPHTPYEAKFSAPYMVAAALVGGTDLGIAIDNFADALINDPTRCTLMSRITVGSDPRCDAIFPDHAPAILSITTTVAV